MKTTERKPYWQETKLVAVLCLLVPMLAVLVIPAFVTLLNRGKFLEFPLGYYLVAHGLIIILIGATAVFMLRQDDVDRMHGANEDI